MTVVVADDYRRRSRLWRERDAYEETDLAPSGEAGGLIPRCWRINAIAPDLSDCLVVRPRPFRLTIWEPLLTKAPGPHLARTYCCYIQTVIFYHRPYIKSPWVKLFRTHRGWSHNGSPGHFEEWDQIETRLASDHVVEFEGELFTLGGGRVMWVNAPGQPRRWWMRHQARRKAV
jgi:hypothetical protein